MRPICVFGPVWNSVFEAYHDLQESICAVWTLMVVAMTPVLEHLPHLAHAFEDVAIEHFGTHGSIEAFDKRVLRRLAGLDEAQFDRVFLCPIRQRLTDQLRSIVEP